MGVASLRVLPPIKRVFKVSPSTTKSEPGGTPDLPIDCMNGKLVIVRQAI